MRGFNRVASAVLGLILLAVGLIAAAELAVTAAGRRPWPSWLDQWLARWLTTPLSDPGVFWSAVAVGAIGLLIVVFQLRRWRPDRLPTGDADEGVWWVSRRGVERRAKARAASLAGVHGARADIRGGARHWRVHVSAEAKPEQTPSLERMLREELSRMDLPEGVPVEVALKPPRRVA